MVRATLAVFVSVLCGCGGTDWAGTYSGLLASTATCAVCLPGGACGNSGPPSTENINAAMQLTTIDDKTIELSGGDSGFCPNTRAAVDPKDDTVAVVQPITCMKVESGSSVTTTIKNGTLVLDGNALTVAIAMDTAVTGSGSTIACSGQSSGTLTRPKKK